MPRFKDLVEELVQQVREQYGIQHYELQLFEIAAFTLCAKYGKPYDHLLIVGPPGTAKSRSVEACCTLAGVPYRYCLCNVDMTPSELIGSIDPVVFRRAKDVESLLTGEDIMEVVAPGPLLLADPAWASRFTGYTGDAKYGVLFVDELNRMPPQTQRALNTAMAQGVVFIPNVGSVDVRVRVVAAINPYGFSLEQGTFNIPTALRSRFKFIIMDYLPPEKEKDVAKVIFARYGVELSDRAALALAKLVAELRKVVMVSPRFYEGLAMDFMDEVPKVTCLTLQGVPDTVYLGHLGAGLTITEYYEEHNAELLEVIRAWKRETLSRMAEEEAKKEPQEIIEAERLAEKVEAARPPSLKPVKLPDGSWACPICGKKFKDRLQVQGHLVWCKKKRGL